MGTQISTILKGLTCETCYKYVLNDWHCHTECCDCCDMNCDTNEVALSDPDDNIKVDVGDMVHVKA